MENIQVWFKGDIIPVNEAQVGILSPGFQFGLNVFEGVRGYWDENINQLYLFRLEDHLQRLGESCKLMRMKCPYDVDQIRGYFKEICAANKIEADTIFRLTIFMEGEGSWFSKNPVGMFIYPYTRPRLVVEEIEGKNACISSWERISDRSMPPRIKTGANYINGRHAHLEAVANGYDLPILLNSNGNVSEGAGACLMMVKSGALIAPPLSASVLQSITRMTLLEIASNLNMPIEERDIPRSELYIADEVFLCGTTPEVTPIKSIDHIQIGDSAPGEVTKLLIAEYHKVVSGSNRDFLEWITAVY